MCRLALSSVIFLSAFCLVTGCGEKGAPNLKLTGKVTVKGEPAQNVDITLHSQDGQTYSGKTGDDGSFTISGVQPGQMTITIASAPGGYNSGPTSGGSAGGAASKYGGSQGGSKAPGGGKSDAGKSGPGNDSKSKERMKEDMKQMEGKMPTPPSTTKIAAKYGDKAKSGLSWNVTPEKLTQDFDLTE